eukprot:COSAG01_NODE_6402_length_3685_cov_161.988846_2_plen_105_part_00
MIELLTLIHWLLAAGMGVMMTSEDRQSGLSFFHSAGRLKPAWMAQLKERVSGLLPAEACCLPQRSLFQLCHPSRFESIYCTIRSSRSYRRSTVVRWLPGWLSPS